MRSTTHVIELIQNIEAQVITAVNPQQTHGYSSIEEVTIFALLLLLVHLITAAAA